MTRIYSVRNLKQSALNLIFIRREYGIRQNILNSASDIVGMSVNVADTNFKAVISDSFWPDLCLRRSVNMRSYII